MELPQTVKCGRCGAVASVPRQSIDEDAGAGQLRGFDQAWKKGYWFTIECPNCGRIDQQFELPQTS
jgi:ribosomal protein S27E